MEKLSPSLGLRRISTIFLLLCLSLVASAQSARFDLTGPKIDVNVTRDGRTLPIAYVPNLQAGDKIWLHPDLPPTQSVHLLLIAAFLRGTTNPPPDDWFIKIETWNPRIREEGVSITVPAEAQQAILFLAPETGGDFTTLRKAVRGRPGVFVRASQDLIDAGFEQARIEKYVASMRQVPPADSQALLDHSNLLARTLNLKPNDDCFKRSVDLQYNCLTQSGNQTLLDDGHAQNLIAQISNGASSDFITAASYTGVVGGGTYSAYVGAVVDLFRILGSLHTAQYQYIPAIAFPEEASLNLRLNTPPSFRNPKSVIVIGLPSIQKSFAPPLRPADPNAIACLLKPRVVLPVEGAPLVFSASFAHDLVLHLNVPDQDSSLVTKDIPLVPDAYQGGLIVAHAPERRPLPEPSQTDQPPVAASNTPKTISSPTSVPLNGDITGTITGSWGFDTFTGPTFHLQSIPGQNWAVAASNPLIAGRENDAMLSSTGGACVASVRLEVNPGNFVSTQWKPHENFIEVKLPLQSPTPGAFHIAVQQFGEADPAMITARTFSIPATLAALQLHAGDTYAVATGTNLGQVQQMTVSGLTFVPAPPASDSPEPTAAPDTLRLTLPPNTPSKLRAGESLSAAFTLTDGRVLTLPVTIAPARPVVTLLSRNMGHPSNSDLHLGSDDDLPASQQLTFSLKSPAPFLRAGKIEIANADETLRTELTIPAGTLVLQNPHTLLGTLDPLKTFGPSAFGPLRLRAVSPDGVPGDWLPLTTLVRLPALTNITCPAEAAALCTLNGSNLYLLEAVSTNPDFTAPTVVPEGFVAATLSIPRPATLRAASARPTTIPLFLHLRDDPNSISYATVPLVPTSRTPAATSAAVPAPSTAPAPPIPTPPAASTQPLTKYTSTN